MWIEIGAALHAQILSGTEDRNQATTRFALEIGRDPTAVGRILRAYEYVLAYVPETQAVTAPFASIEVLARIERLDALRAAEIRATVLRGDMTTSDLRALEQQLIVAKQNVPEQIRLLTLTQILEVCDSSKELEIRFELVKYARVSHTTAWVGANVELVENPIEIDGQSNNSCSWALIISPSIKCSRLAGLKFDDFLSSIVKSLWFYKIISVFCASEAERQQIVGFFSLHHTEPSSRVVFHEWNLEASGSS